jgi:hypothetical protein
VRYWSPWGILPPGADTGAIVTTFGFIPPPWRTAKWYKVTNTSTCGRLAKDRTSVHWCSSGHENNYTIKLVRYERNIKRKSVEQSRTGWLHLECSEVPVSKRVTLGFPITSPK